jgi:inner membrane protein
MIIYYVLLLSFTEQVGFNAAYIIASLATIVLISSFIASVMRNRKIAGIFAGILSLFYIFIFVIIQLEDLALLVGSVGLFITVALLMYFSGKIEWEKR